MDCTSWPHEALTIMTAAAALPDSRLASDTELKSSPNSCDQSPTHLSSSSSHGGACGSLPGSRDGIRVRHRAFCMGRGGLGARRPQSLQSEPNEQLA